MSFAYAKISIKSKRYFQILKAETISIAVEDQVSSTYTRETYER